MKKTLILIAGLTGLTLVVNAQKLSVSQVPEVVKSSFSKAHPDVKSVVWEKEKKDFEVHFKLKNQQVSENYTTEGQLVESEASIRSTDLPDAVKVFIGAHYKGAKIKEAAKITKADGTVNYEAEINGKDILFDAKGNLLK